MAAVIHGARAGRGGPGRAQGRQRGRVVVDVPAQVIGPLGNQWLYWQGGNANVSREPTKAEIKEQLMFQRLESSPKVAPEELLIYAVTDALARQPQPIVDMLNAIVVRYNRMGDMRCQYLFKKIEGFQGREMFQMLKKLQEDKEEVEGRIEDVRSAGGFCPPLPEVFVELPKLI